MLILFDNGTPQDLPVILAATVRNRGPRLGGTQNGELIDAAEQAGFDPIVTTDKNIRYQQNLKTRKIALVVLGNS